jgi:hypothetical protein
VRRDPNTKPKYVNFEKLRRSQFKAAERWFRIRDVLAAKEPLSPQDRAWLVEVMDKLSESPEKARGLLGLKKRPGRTAGARVQHYQVVNALRMIELMESGHSYDRAAEQVAGESHLSPEAIKKQYSKHKEDALALRETRLNLETFLNTFHEKPASAFSAASAVKAAQEFSREIASFFSPNKPKV